MASPITHAFIGAAFPTALLGRKAGLPVTLLSMTCATIPDFDKVVAKVLGIFTAISLAPMWSHRGISHSFLFALILSLLATFVTVRRHWSSEPWRMLFLMFFLVSVSHGLIDVFVGPNGVALLAPLSMVRYSHPIAAIPTIGVWQYFTPALGPVLLQEVLWIWLPFSILFALIRATCVLRGRDFISRPVAALLRGRRVAEEKPAE